MQTNFISRILKHKTAANLFLILMFILGLYSSKELNTQFFPNYLNPGDVLVFNNTRVIPARVFGKSKSSSNSRVL